MLYIGSHVSYKKDSELVGSVNEAISYNSNAFMFYTGAPQNTKRDKIDDNLTLKAYEIMKENNIMLENVIIHAPYIINIANSVDLEKWEFGKNFLRTEIERAEKLGIKYIVLHPGSSVGAPVEVALNRVVKALNSVLLESDNIVICIETMAGKGNEVGRNIDELKYIIDNISLKDKIGVCLDTCHLNDSGVDISKFDEYLDEFDSKIGINKIHVVHVNDSKNFLGSHKDRHENLGYGTIGYDNLINVIYNKRLENIPKILETPYIEGYPPYKFEIESIRNKKFNSNLTNDVINYYK